MATRQSDQDRLDQELEDQIAAILAEDDAGPIFDPPEGVPLADGPDHTQAIFIRKKPDPERG